MHSLIGTTGTTGTIADDVLVDRAARNDRDAFGALYDRHSQRVFAHSARQLGGIQDADDLTAIVFLEAWRLRARIRFVNGSALPWLLMTATNVARNYRRSARRYRAVLNRIPAPRASPDHADSVAATATFEATGQTLAQALTTLRPMDRHVVSLCLISELTYAEAAQVLGISHAAVRSRLMRSREAIRSALLEAGITSAEEGLKQ